MKGGRLRGVGNVVADVEVSIRALLVKGGRLSILCRRVGLRFVSIRALLVKGGRLTRNRHHRKRKRSFNPRPPGEGRATSGIGDVVADVEVSIRALLVKGGRRESKRVQRLDP